MSNASEIETLGNSLRGAGAQAICFLQVQALFNKRLSNITTLRTLFNKFDKMST